MDAMTTETGCNDDDSSSTASSDDTDTSEDEQCYPLLPDWFNRLLPPHRNSLKNWTEVLRDSGNSTSTKDWALLLAHTCLDFLVLDDLGDCWQTLQRALTTLERTGSFDQGHGAMPARQHWGHCRALSISRLVGRVRHLWEGHRQSALKSYRSSLSKTEAKAFNGCSQLYRKSIASKFTAQRENQGSLTREALETEGNGDGDYSNSQERPSDDEECNTQVIDTLACSWSSALELRAYLDLSNHLVLPLLHCSEDVASITRLLSLYSPVDGLTFERSQSQRRLRLGLQGQRSDLWQALSFLVPAMSPLTHVFVSELDLDGCQPIAAKISTTVSGFSDLPLLPVSLASCDVGVVQYRWPAGLPSPCEAAEAAGSLVLQRSLLNEVIASSSLLEQPPLLPRLSTMCAARISGQSSTSDASLLLSECPSHLRSLIENCYRCVSCQRLVDETSPERLHGLDTIRKAGFKPRLLLGLGNGSILSTPPLLQRALGRDGRPKNFLVGGAGPHCRSTTTEETSQWRFCAKCLAAHVRASSSSEGDPCNCILCTR